VKEARDRIVRAGVAEAFEHTVTAIVITDTNGIIYSINPAFTTMTGYSQEDALGQNLRFLKSGRQSQAFYEQMCRPRRLE